MEKSAELYVNDVYIGKFDNLGDADEFAREIEPAFKAMGSKFDVKVQIDRKPDWYETMFEIARECH
jgi:hypothetical protein